MVGSRSSLLCLAVAGLWIAGCPAKPDTAKAPSKGAASKPASAASKPANTASKPAKAATKTATSAAKVPAHYFNDKANLNPDPNFTPGEFPAPDTKDAQKVFEAKKSEVAKKHSRIRTLPGGELTFGIPKNETKRVFGYFRKYESAIRVGDKGPEHVELVVDVNSLDTAVPHRDNRIKTLFFESMKPELGTATVVFDKIDLGGKAWAELVKDGGVFTAQGNLSVNGASKPLSAKLELTKEEGKLFVETVDRINISIADFGFGARIYALLKSCNHKSIGNTVDLGARIPLSL